MPSDRVPMRPPSRTRARTVILLFGALLFLFEEWLWTGLTRMFGWLGRFGVTRWLDARLARLPSGGALVMLCMPIVLLFPFKVVGLWMIATGHLVTGCLVMLAAKVASTAVIARIFFTCRPQLLRMPWFARLYASTCLLRDRIHQWVEEQPAWRDAKSTVRRAKTWILLWRFGSGTSGIRRSALRRWRSRRKARRQGATASGVPAPGSGHRGEQRGR